MPAVQGPRPFEGMTAFVTGGGSGIGAATALALAGQGAQVIVAARTQGAIEDVARRIGGRAVSCDVTDADSVAAAVLAAGYDLAAPDILVNAAGASDSAPLARTSDELWARMIAVNLTGTFHLMRAFVPAMAARGSGRVVNVASTAGRAGFPYTAAYSAAKHGVVGLTRAVAAEFASKGLTVNAVCPGYVDTPMTARNVERIAGKTGRSLEQALEALRAMNPQGRLVTPGEVAFAIVSLCRADAASINGQAIVVDGGALQR